MMRSILFLSLILFLSISCQSNKKEKTISEATTTVYYFIRHAEKDRSDVTNKDPELTNLGIQRAKKWAIHFEDIELDQIYSTDYKRTQQTAMFIATDHNIQVQSYDSGNIYNEDFKKKTKFKSVLIVGHSNTTPSFVNTIIGSQKYGQIEDANNGNLYIVTIEGDKTTSVLENYN